jgi:predicted Zn-dependent protease
MTRSRALLLTILSLTAFALHLSSCASVTPFRSAADLQLDEDEKRLWKRSEEEAKRLDSSGQLDESAALLAYVNAVAAKLLPEELRQQKLAITVKVVKNPLLNAFALANGVIYIHSGLLAKMENESQLAAILSHEITHITHRHMLQSFRNVQNASVALTALQLAGIPFGLYGSLAGLLGALSATAAVSGYSRALENEADTRGFELLVKAGYDPTQASKLFEYLKAELEEQNINEPFFFGSHPRLAERQENWAALAKRLGSPGGGETGAERYQGEIRSLLLETAQMDLSFGRWSWAEEVIAKYIRLYPEKPEGRFYMGELFRRRAGKEDHEKAEREYRAAIELDATYAPSRAGLGRIYLAAGKQEEARRAFTEYLALAPAAADRGYIEQYLKGMRIQP